MGYGLTVGSAGTLGGRCFVYVGWLMALPFTVWLGWQEYSTFLLLFCRSVVLCVLFILCFGGGSFGQDCIQAFFSAERLRGANQYECDGCGSKREAGESMFMEKLLFAVKSEKRGCSFILADFCFIDLVINSFLWR